VLADGSVSLRWPQPPAWGRPEGFLEVITRPNESYGERNGDGTGYVFERWFRGPRHPNRAGTLHRTDGPAHLVTFKDGSTFEIWAQNDRYHREDGPAMAGVVEKDLYARQEVWYRHGVIARRDGPARLRELHDGTVEQWWYEDGDIHRAGGPALRVSQRDGTVIEAWYERGKLHRMEAPAVIVSHPDGRRTETFFEHHKLTETSGRAARRVVAADGTVTDQRLDPVSFRVEVCPLPWHLEEPVLSACYRVAADNHYLLLDRVLLVEASG
jgi:hypothetical protein